ncbi:MAG: hypothetical protein V7733_00450 [Paraglaciecola polaris]|tara:strand:+ start:5144 stop:5863 length:720 start_codon:yes stop_codon:yes gene_type:complete
MITRHAMLLVFSLVLVTTTATAGHKIISNNVVDKIYHPYVLPLEQEFEWRFMSRQNDDGNSLVQRLAYGRSINERVAVEVNLVGDRDQKDDFGLVSYELAARWMITEQGKYFADWGALFEIEKEVQRDAWEFTSGILVEKEFGRTSITGNYLVVYKFGNVVDNSFHSEFRMQYRYRFIPEIQPALELYTAEDFVGLGPSFMGIHRFDGQKQIKWEMGFIAGLNGDSKDHTLRASVEYEF